MFDGIRPAGIRVAGATLVIGIAAFAAMLPSQVAQAAADTVTTCAGSGPGSLPAAVKAASSGSTISFSVSCPPTSPITLAKTIDIKRNLFIDGPGSSSLAVSGNNSVEVFDIASGATVSISGVTVQDGSATNGGGIYDDGGPLSLTNIVVTGNSATSGGGGIAGGPLTVVDSLLSDNSAAQGGGMDGEGTVTNTVISDNTAETGGGIVVEDSSTISHSTLSENTATGSVSTPGMGGAILVPEGGGLLALSYSTVSGNQVSGSGGGLANIDLVRASNTTFSGNTTTSGTGDYGGGAIFDEGGTSLENSTISGNSTTGQGGGDHISEAGSDEIYDSTFSGNSASGANSGGALYEDEGGVASLSGTIVANSASGGDCHGNIHNSGYNLDDDGTCGLSGDSTSHSGVNPDLGPLQNNGGPTETQAPASDSLALNQIPTGTEWLCPGIDQRGVARPQGSECDIGAVELSPSGAPQAIISPNGASATVGSSFTFTVTTSGTTMSPSLLK
jgi:predicted outer membrane repeat protein